MINFDIVEKLMLDRNLPCVKVSDWNNSKILEITDFEQAPAAVEKLKEYKELLDGYGRVKIKLGTQKQCNGNWSGALELECKTGGNNVTPTPNMGLAGHYNHYSIPQNFVPTEVMEAKLEALRKEMEWNAKFQQLEAKLNQDKGIADSLLSKENLPYIMAAMFPDNPNISKLAGRNDAPVNNNLDPNLEKKLNRINELMGSIADKVKLDDLILLLTKVNENPGLVQQALNFL